MKTTALMILLSGMVLTLAGCSDDATPAKAEPKAEAKQEATTGLANPGAEYCAKLGGEYKIVEEAAGKRGECHLPDGKVEDAMELFRSHATAEKLSDEAAAIAGAATAAAGKIADEASATANKIADDASTAAHKIADDATATADKITDEAKKVIGMANPAAEYCAKVGGEHKIVKEAAGDVGYCHLKDGQVVNAWEYFRANHKQQ